MLKTFHWLPRASRRESQTLNPAGRAIHAPIPVFLAPFFSLLPSHFTAQKQPALSCDLQPRRTLFHTSILYFHTYSFTRNVLLHFRHLVNAIHALKPITGVTFHPSCLTGFKSHSSVFLPRMLDDLLPI